MHQQLTLYYKSIEIPEPTSHASFSNFLLELFNNNESDICLKDKMERKTNANKTFSIGNIINKTQLLNPS